MPRFRRPRAALLSAVGAVAAGALVVVGLSGCGVFGRTIDTVGAVDFTAPLAIPPLAASTVDAEGTRVFELTAQPGTTEFSRGAASETWGYSSPGHPSSLLGPTLRAARGERVAVRFRNGLEQTTTLHWHGMHLPAVMDGGPHQPVEPGDEWVPSWAVDQPAATLWYHPHPHGETEHQVAMGLAGMFVLDDPLEAALPLPREYGVDDVPVIVQDLSFDDAGVRDRPDDQFVGALGDAVVVNGTLGPYLEVATDVVRLRLLNASPARTYRFALDDGRDLAQIASDGGLLAAPWITDAVQLSPGERAEVLVRMAPGETAILRSEAPDLGVQGVLAAQTGATDRFDVLELRAAPQLRSAGTVPDVLVPLERLDAASADRERSLVMDGTQFDQREMEMSRVDQVVDVDSTEVWAVRNNMAMPHNFHIHDVQFQVATVDGEPPGPQLQGWKDTVYLRPNTEYRLVMRFEDYADPEHPYMYHCHLLRHEDSGMMAQFVVVAPDDDVAEIRTTTTMGTGQDHDHDH